MRHVIATLVCLLLLCTSASADVTRALLLSSYGPTFPTFMDQIQGIRSILDPAGITLDVEYMDSKRIHDQQHLSNYKALLTYKFQALPRPQILITADDNALRFAMENRQSLFGDIPLVFCGVNNAQLATQAMRTLKDVTGVMENISARATIGLARELFPNARTVALIYDDTPSGKTDFKRVLPVTRLFPWLKFERFNLARITFAELAAGLRAMTPDSFVLLLSAYRDREGTNKSFDESLRLIRKASKSPIFHLWKHGIGQGVLGGKVVDHYKQGQLAAKAGLSIIKGVDPATLPIIQGEDANSFMLDSRELARFQLDTKQLPESSRILNYPAQEKEESKQAFIRAVLLVLLLFFTGLLIHLLHSRRHLKVRLRESEARHKTYMDLSPDGQLICDNHGRLLEVNHALQTMTRFSQEELLQMFLVDLLPLEGRADFMEGFDIFRRQGEFSGGIAIRCKSGELIYAFVDAMKLEEGRYIGFLKDITARRQDQIALKESEERFRALIEQAEDAMFVHDMAGQYILVNRKACEVLEYSREELMRLTVWDVDPSTPSDAVKTVWAYAPRKMETEYVRRSGSILPVEVQISRITFAGREVVFSLARDMTERRVAEGRLRRESRVNLAQAEIAKVLTSPESSIETIAEAVRLHAMKITGSEYGYVSSIDPISGDNIIYTFTEMADAGKCNVSTGTFRLPAHGKNYSALWGYALRERQAFFTNDPLGHESSQGLPSGHVPIHQFLSAPAMYEDQLLGQIALADPGRDYTNEDLWVVVALADLFAIAVQRRHAEGALVSAKDAAEAASKAKGEFLANVSHEIRTPLNGIFGMLQLMQATELNDEQSEYLTTAMNSGQNLLRVINDVLDFSKIEAGKIELQAERFSLRQLISSVHAIFSTQANEKGLSFTWNVDSEAHDMLVGDAGRIRQILFNLLGNAIKFTNEGEIVIEADTLPEPGAPNQVNLFFSVADTGIGIPEEKLDLIFRAFEQVDGSHSRKYPGTGLGLGIVRRFVELMDGQVKVKSSEGMGSTFSFSVKVDLAAQDDREEVVLTPIPPDMPKLRILLAEDDRVNRITAQRLLEKLGHSVAWAQNGREALDLLQEQEFDCVFMDIQMPQMDGLEAVEHMRASDDPAIAKKPVIALTAHAMKGDKEQFLEAGMDDYVSKPVNKKDLDAVLRRVMLKGGSYRGLD